MVVIGTYLTRALGIIHLEMKENAEESGRKPVREQHLLLQEHLCLESALLEGKGGEEEQRALTEIEFTNWIKTPILGWKIMSLLLEFLRQSKLSVTSDTVTQFWSSHAPIPMAW